MSSTVGDSDCSHTEHSAVAVISDASALTCNSSAPAGQHPNAVSATEKGPQVLTLTPYTTGFTFKAWRHCPPAPFGLGYSTPSPARHPDSAAALQEELCTSRQPREGHTLFENEELFTITSTLRTGGFGAQIVVVNHEMVAKIYDPLFYDDDSEGYENPLWRADKSYSREAAAYEQLQKSKDISDIVPAFYGTWTFNIDTTIMQGGVATEATRGVRMILIEHLKGQCMMDVDAHTLLEPIRTSILKQCLEAYIRVSQAGVSHGDLSPRNIMILGSVSNPSDVRVKLIDFDVATVYDHPNYKFPENAVNRENFSRKWSPKLPSPVVMFFRKMAEFSCEGWCPDEDRGSDQWLWQNYAEDDRYATVQWNRNERFARPIYANPDAKMEQPVSNVIISRSGSEIATSSSDSNASSGSNGSNESNGSNDGNGSDESNGSIGN